jgi:hypothetical protein
MYEARGGGLAVFSVFSFLGLVQAASIHRTSHPWVEETQQSVMRKRWAYARAVNGTGFMTPDTYNQGPVGRSADVQAECLTQQMMRTDLTACR